MRIEAGRAARGDPRSARGGRRNCMFCCSSPPPLGSKAREGRSQIAGLRQRGQIAPVSKLPPQLQVRLHGLGQHEHVVRHAGARVVGAGAVGHRSRRSAALSGLPAADHRIVGVAGVPGGVGADDGDPVSPLGQLRKGAAEGDARQPGRHFAGDAAEFDGRTHLRIEKLDLRRARLAGTAARPTFSPASAPWRRLPATAAQKDVPASARPRQPADAEQIARVGPAHVRSPAGSRIASMDFLLPRGRRKPVGNGSWTAIASFGCGISRADRRSLRPQSR